MTQMGLEYMKLLESQRHNQADESIRGRGNDISQQEADTKAYSASFEPQRVANATKSANAASKDADTRRLSEERNREYAEREMLVKERGATSAERQAGAAERNAASSERQATASQSQADSARRNAAVNEQRYTPTIVERTVTAAEQSAQARLSSAEASKLKAETDRLLGLMKELGWSERAEMAARELGKSDSDALMSTLGRLGEELTNILSGTIRRSR